MHASLLRGQVSMRIASQTGWRWWSNKLMRTKFLKSAAIHHPACVQGPLITV